jgi:hypothetical protein
MHTDYKNINKFDVAIVAMIAIGFIITGVFLFASLTPRVQMNVTTSLQMFDVHEQFAKTMDTTAFVIDLPNEFFNQFYIAFTEVATLPPEIFETPRDIVLELKRNVTVAINNLADQVATGYAAQNDQEVQIAQTARVAYNGKVMGAVIDVTDAIAEFSVEQPIKNILEIPYSYQVPSFAQLTISVNKFLKPN